MCGILGEFSSVGNLSPKNDFLDILSISKNRGPNNTKYFSNNKIQFGFNRLSILDLNETGNQPITSNDKRYIMVYNGEVYNYLNLKKELEKHGILFVSTGDSEVLINAFSFYGVRKTIELIDGMFAIALYDMKLKRLHLIRDFAGIKPLYYAQNKESIFFASQYDQILKFSNFKNNQINPDVFKLYLSLQYMPDPFGFYKNTHQLSPGEIVTFNGNGEKKKEKYWELPKKQTHIISNKSHAIDYIQNSLENSVKDQLISDQPLGAFLSGGIDSPLICNFANKNVNFNLKSFTIGSDSKVHDESEDSGKYAKLIGLKHYITKMKGQDVSDILEDTMKCITEPFADFSVIPTYLVSSIAKKYVSVVLSGDGGDELFFGYERFWSIAKNLNIQHLPYFLKYSIYGLDRILSDNKYHNSASLFEKESEAHQNLHTRFDLKMLNKIFPDLRSIDLPKKYGIYDYPKVRNEEDLLQLMRHSEFYGMMQKTLKKVDMASMRNSLEVRVPFLQKTFIQASLEIDPYLSYGPNKGKISNKKNILKNILRKQLPSAPISNIKKGFSIPLSRWIKEELRETISEVMMDKSLNDYFGINIIKSEKMLSNHMNGKVDNKFPIFTIYSMFKWKDQSFK